MTPRVSDHFDGEKFFNPSLANGRPTSAVPKMLVESRSAWPSSIPVQQRTPQPHDPSAWATVTFIGHSTFLIQTAAGSILTDPVFSERARRLRRIPATASLRWVSFAPLEPFPSNGVGLAFTDDGRSN